MQDNLKEIEKKKVIPAAGFQNNQFLKVCGLNLVLVSFKRILKQDFRFNLKSSFYSNTISTKGAFQLHLSITCFL